MVPYKPKQRDGHTATLIDNKLYILGGEYINDSGPDVGKDFFYLDVSVSFNTQNLSWNDLSNINIIPSHFDAASVKGGANNSSLFLYGGNNNTTMDLVYIFNPQGDSWNIPKITGNIGTRKSGLTGIIDYKGIMYLWGGYDDHGNEVNDMLILDTINLVWGKGSLVGVPTVREYYGGTLLADNNIIYIGGYDGKELTLNQVYLYDTINDSWSTETTSGEVPSGRDGFSTVLGMVGWPKSNNLWSRMYHKANVIGKYMVISFGDGYDQLTESDILLLDISNVDEYTWTNEFYPLPPTLPPSPSSTPFNTSPSNKLSSSSSMPLSAATTTTTVIGAVLGSLFGAALLSFGGFYLYKNKRRDDNNQIERNIDAQEIVQPPSNVYINNERLTLHELQQEFKDLKQIILQNSKQSTNVMGNNRY
ncbi:hypothetical protein GLOIN_2v1761507 [Rhizophagus clarus]|uniref:Galactose oxidase n=1 Tax=Rhizophagus clarus TaxID=94130 RepID=A0A8H3R6E8_9GLOM|nr:hypothetical protein GLOIN_2v1761507 [Rhizophagus clarus]